MLFLLMISKEKKLLMAVEDNGPGFPENEISHVFDKFYRLKNSKTGGTGLGLSIVKGFVESMNGNIILEGKVPYTDGVFLSNQSIIGQISDVYVITYSFKDTGLNQDIDQSKAFSTGIQVINK